MMRAEAPLFALPAMSGIERLLLELCLVDDAAVPLVLDKLIAQAGTEETAFTGLQPKIQDLIAIVATRVLRLPDQTPPDWQPRLRAGRSVEAIRARAFGDITAALLGHPSLAALDPIVTEGPAIAAAHYPDGFLRHTARLSLTLPDAKSFDPAARALAALDCRIETETESGSRRIYRHPTGMPIVLFGGSPCPRIDGLTHAALLADARDVTLAGLPALIPSPRDLWCEHLYRHATGGVSALPQWLADLAWLARSPDITPQDAGSFRPDAARQIDFAAYAEALTGVLPDGIIGRA